VLFTVSPVFSAEELSSVPSTRLTSGETETLCITKIITLINAKENKHQLSVDQTLTNWDNSFDELTALSPDIFSHEVFIDVQRIIRDTFRMKERLEKHETYMQLIRIEAYWCRYYQY
jgi:hypothetical protein